MKLALALTLVVASVTRAWAHGGEDHGDVATSASTEAGTDGQRTAYGQTGEFEVLLKFTPAAQGAATSMMVFVADYATNAPIEKARVEVELAGPTTVKTVAEPTPSPGIYHAMVEAPPATYAAIVTVEAAPRLDLIDIKQVDLTPPAKAATSRVGPPRMAPWALAAVAAGGVFLLFVLILALRRRSARRRSSAVVGLLALIAGPLAARGHGGEDHGEAQPEESTGTTATGGIYVAKESQFLLQIRTAITAEREIEARIQSIGRIIPRNDGHAEIFAPQPGRIVAVGGKLPFLGDKVKKGQKLVVIEQTLGAAEAGDIRAEAIRARSAIAEAQAQLAQRRRDLERLRSLKGVVAEKEVQAAELEVKLAEEAVSRARREAGLFGGASLQRLTITAPIDGIIAESDISIGEQVTGDKRLFTIIEPTTLWVEADVFEKDLARVQQIGSAAVRVEGYEQVFQASVFRVGQLIDPNTRTVKVIFAVDNKDGQLRPGMFAEVAIGAGQPTKQLAVPDAAVVEEGGRRFVFVHTAPEEFVRREVVLGTRDGDVWAVSRGLQRGERVVVQGTYQLRTAR